MLLWRIFHSFVAATVNLISLLQKSGIAFGFLVGIFTLAVGLSEDAMWGFIIPFQIYTIVGIWRSSDNYKGPKFWAVLAKIAIILGIISSFAQILMGY